YIWRSLDRDRGDPRAVSGDGAASAYATSLADLGQLLLVRGEARESIRVLEWARELAPTEAHIRNNLGVAYRKAGRFADAFQELRVAAELAPGRASTYHNLSRLHLAAGDEESALEALSLASRLQPENVRYRLELAGLHEKRGDFQRAESIFRWVERSAGDDLPARLAYGDFLLRRERYTEAVAAYRRAQEASPTSAGVFTSLSRCYWEMEDIDAAVAAMRRSVELQPHNPRLKYDLALMLQRSGEPGEALVHLDDVLRLLPNAWQPVALKASILTRLGMHDEARRLFTKAREMGAEGAQFRAAWSELELAEGDTAAARELLERGP
ncbi:MAG: tetratricopeptide repeat protein, partial [Candidatus Eisenbacteria bacterium]|nr:tetratricopeptide repeat protein [Candidatus Eisenbacteria bacterium]